MANVLPTVLIGGYLGAGKTTLINQLLRQAQGRRIAVLVNDFGSVNIDAALIAAEQPEATTGVLSLAGGCLCCSFGDDLLGTMNSLAQRQPPPDVCIIELSGVALPAAVQRCLRLSRAVRLDVSLVLADAGQIQNQLADPYLGDTLRQQLVAADWVLLSKPDVLAAADLKSTRQWLQAWLAQQAPQVQSWDGTAAALWPELLLGWRAATAAPAADARAARAAEAQGLAVFGGRALAPAAPPSPFESLTLHLSQALSRQTLQALAQEWALAGSGVLRAKGLATDAAGQTWLLQLAAGRWTLLPTHIQQPSTLVLIGLRERWDKAALQQRVQTCG